MLRSLFLITLLLATTHGFLEETEGVDPGERTCTPDEERLAQSCKRGVEVISLAFDTIQGQHQLFTAGEHIGIDQNCKTSLTCLKSNVGCSGITQEDVELVKQKCEYLTYLTGGFYPCSQKLAARDKSDCLLNFFDAEPEKGTSQEEICEAWSRNRACLKWTIRDACSRSYWKQYKPFWHLRYQLMKCV